MKKNYTISVVDFDRIPKALHQRQYIAYQKLHDSANQLFTQFNRITWKITART